MAEIEQFLNAIMAPGHVHEVRIFGAAVNGTWPADWHTFSDDAAHLAEVCRKATEDGQANAVYVSLNPVIRDLRAITGDEIIKQGKGAGATDAHVIRRRWLLMDFDAVKPAKEMMASDAERGEAIDQRDRTHKALTKRGWPEPIVSDSGNGGALIYRIDLPNDDDAYQLVADVLASISIKAPAIDQTVKNASRITRVCGTWNRKGSDLTSDKCRDGESPRPWRRAEMVSCPTLNGHVTVDQLKALVDELKPKEPPRTVQTTPVTAGSKRDHLIKRAIAYCEKADAAIEGQHGDQRTFNLAGHLLAIDQDGERLDAVEVVEVMVKSGWNGRCSPPWDEAQLFVKVDSAARNGSPRAPKTAKPMPMLSTPRETEKPLMTDVEVSDLIPLNTLDMEPINWLWPDRIMCGNLNMIFGEGKAGKSQITMDIAATVSTGRPWTDGTPCEAGDVIIINGEDGLKDTIVPRLTASGADLSRICSLSMVSKLDKDGNLTKQYFSLADLPQLHANLRTRPKTRLIIIDPIGSFMAGADTHRDSDVRSVLTPLKELVDELGIAVLLVAHVGKSRGSSAVQKVLGSVAFSNAVRSSMYVALGDDGTTRIMAHAAGNIAVGGVPSLRFGLETANLVNSKGQRIVTSRVRWDGTTDITADQLAASSEQSKASKDDAKDILTEMLADGPRKKKDIQSEAEDRGISPATLWRAAKKMGVNMGRGGFQGGAVWSLSDKDSETVTTEEPVPPSFHFPMLVKPQGRSDQNLKRAVADDIEW